MKMLKRRKRTKMEQEAFDDGYRAGLVDGRLQGVEDFAKEIKKMLGITDCTHDNFVTN